MGPYNGPRVHGPFNTGKSKTWWAFTNFDGPSGNFDGPSGNFDGPKNPLYLPEIKINTGFE